jgi:hypothetical protein
MRPLARCQRRSQHRPQLTSQVEDHYGPSVYSIPSSNGASFAYTAVGQRVIGINRNGWSQGDLPGVLAHEATHLMQNEDAGNPVASQGDELEAYKVQRRIDIAVKGSSQLSSDIEGYGPGSDAGRAFVIGRYDIYQYWPTERPSGLAAVFYGSREVSVSYAYFVRGIPGVVASAATGEWSALASTPSRLAAPASYAAWSYIMSGLG